MQKVSKAYRDSMKSSLRERAYIMLSFGLINQEAQAKATVEDGDFAYYANAKNVLGEKSDDTPSGLSLQVDMTLITPGTLFSTTASCTSL